MNWDQAEMRKGRKGVVLQERKGGQHKTKMKALILSSVRNINSEILFI